MCEMSGVGLSANSETPMWRRHNQPRRSCACATAPAERGALAPGRCRSVLEPPSRCQQLNTLLSALSAAWQPPAFVARLKDKKMIIFTPREKKLAPCPWVSEGLEIRAAVKRLDGGDAEVHSGRGKPPP